MSLLSLIMGLIVGVLIGVLLTKRATQNFFAKPSSPFKIFLVTHVFIDESKKQELIDYVNKIGSKEVRRRLTGPKAKCHVFLYSKDVVMNHHGYWLAHDAESIRDQLKDFEKYYHKIVIEEISNVHSF